MILALTAIGKNPKSVAGHDLTLVLSDYDKTVWQGINGPVWALLALDSGNYPLEKNAEAKVQATRQMYVDKILSLKLSSGGWNLSEDSSQGLDPDLTAMVLQALAKYRDQPLVAQAVDQALSQLSLAQNSKGGFSSQGVEALESSAQVLVALCELGIDVKDKRFIKNGKSIEDNIMMYYVDGQGFSHVLSPKVSNQMATEQGFYSLVALERARGGKSSLYNMVSK